METDIEKFKEALQVVINGCEKGNRSGAFTLAESAAIFNNIQFIIGKVNEISGK